MRFTSITFLLLACAIAQGGLILTLEGLEGSQGVVLVAAPNCNDLPLLYPNLSFTPIDWTDIPVLALDTLVIGPGEYGYPADINALLGYNQTIYVLEPDELEFLGIPEPASLLLILAGGFWCRRKRVRIKR